MNFTDLLLMRQELLLNLLTVLVVIVDLAVEDKKRDIVIGFSIIFFSIITLVGFFPSRAGSLFGGMYNMSPLNAVMKNLLNIALLVVLLQSVKWLRN